MKKSFASPRAVSVGVLLLVFVMMLILNRMVWLHDDDFHFAFVFFDFLPIEADRRITCLADVFESVRNYYLLSGGRAFSHFLLFLLGMTDKLFFDILNSIAFVAFGTMTAYLAFDKPLERPLLLGSSFLAMFVYIPVFGETCLWEAGAVNYLWGALPALGVMLVCRSALRDRIPSNKLAPLLFLLGFSGGMNNEATGGALIIIIAALMLQRKKIEPWSVVSALGVLGGMALLLLAPGNYVRYNYWEGTGLFSLSSLAMVPVILGKALDALGLPLSIAAFCLASASKPDKRRLFEALTTIFAGMAATSAIALTGNIDPKRAYFFGYVLIVLGCLQCLSLRLDAGAVTEPTKRRAVINAALAVACVYYAFARPLALQLEYPPIMQLIGLGAGIIAAAAATRLYRKKLRFVGAVAVGMLIISGASNYALACIDIAHTASHVAEQQQLLDDALAAGESSVTFDMCICRLSDYNPNIVEKNIGLGNESYQNVWMAKYYGIDRILTGKVIDCHNDIG